MRRLLVVFAIAAAALAGEPGVAKHAAPAPSATPAIARPGKHVRRRSPMCFLRRLGRTEANLAMRLSSWGIRDQESADAHAGSPLPAGDAANTGSRGPVRQ